jgi:catechol 2,3-dioxygenase-like lactoylglutathione lyase family enzyme
MTDASSRSRPTFCQIKLVTRAFDESLRFYGLLGAQFTVRGLHAFAELTNGVRLELDSAQIVSKWDPHWNGMSGGSAFLGFSVATTAEVDTVHAALTVQGFPTHLGPHNAPWGRRLAIVDDPDGNPVAIMGPLADQDRAGDESPSVGDERQK